MKTDRLNNDRAMQICTYCVMDTTDPEISFDEKGVCHHCRALGRLLSTQWFPNEEGMRRWKEISQSISREGKDSEYDSILGLSGGVDSSFLALKVHQWGLRPLVVHVDTGWNSEIAVANIERIVKHCNYDLHTHVVDWEEMRDLHLAYLKAGVANQDVPQDHVISSTLYHFATQNGIRYILSGGNMATEGIFPSSWHGAAMDAINLKAIHERFGKRQLRSYKTISFWQYYVWFPFFKKMRTVRPLNFMFYNKADAIRELQQNLGWRPYGRKHGESNFTKMFQNYYLPTKFGFDKRRPHLSSLIVSGQMSRSEALACLEEPLYDLGELEVDLDYFCKKLRITRAQLRAFMEASSHDHREFPNWELRHKMLKRIQGVIERVLGIRVNVYS